MNIREDFKRANELKFRGDYKEALEIYEKHFKENPESFKFKDKENYAWILYRVNVQTFKDEEDFYGSAEFITQLVPQKDMNVSKNCVYTSAVFSVLNQLNDDNDYFSMICWLDKINPELLDEKPYRKYNRINKSKREKFYDYASRAYYKTQDYDACIEVSTHALESLNSFRDDGDIWLKRNIGMSLKGSGRLTESLPYLLEVIKVKHDWYIYRDIAEVYCMLKRPLDAHNLLVGFVSFAGKHDHIPVLSHPQCAVDRIPAVFNHLIGFARGPDSLFNRGQDNHRVFCPRIV